MNLRENARVMHLIRTSAATAKEELSPSQIKPLSDLLRVLPFEPVHRRVAAYLLEHRWLSSPTEILDAAGLPPKARQYVARALNEGGRVVENPRDITGEGWSYVADGDPDPLGARELQHLRRPEVQAALDSGAPLPVMVEPSQPATVLMLPVGRVDGARQLPEMVAEVKSLANTQSLGTALGRLVPRPPPTDAQVRQAEAEMVRAKQQMEMARDAYVDQAEAYRQFLKQAENDLADGQPPGDAVVEAAVRLLRRVAADPLQGLPVVLDCWRRAAYPHLTARVEETPRAIDRFEDELPERVVVRLEHVKEHAHRSRAPRTPRVVEPTR